MCDDNEDPWAEISALREQIAHLQKFTMYSCPCRHIKPCHDRCSCINQVSSSGCHRCCTYGSKDQRVAMATRIANALAQWDANNP